MNSESAIELPRRPSGANIVVLPDACGNICISANAKGYRYLSDIFQHMAQSTESDFHLHLAGIDGDGEVAEASLSLILYMQLDVAPVADEKK